jgi:hypothetical protein
MYYELLVMMLVDHHLNALDEKEDACVDNDVAIPYQKLASIIDKKKSIC